MDPRLWEIKTTVFTIPRGNSYLVNVYPYYSFKDFIDCKPYNMWKPYILSSWAWDEATNQVQVIFLTPYSDGMGTSYVTFPVKKEEEPAIREWLKKHISPIWKI
jgi:hypothetical protein